MSQAIVIGSGIGGIASAIRLRVKGYEVSVYEKNTCAGGKIAEIKVDGFRFDKGPSLFTMPHYVDELFQLAGRSPSAYFSYHRLSKVCKYFWNDGVAFTAYSAKKELKEEVERVFQGEGNRFLDKLEKAALIESLTGELFLEQSIHRYVNFLNAKTLKALLRLPKFGLNKTLHEVNVSAFNDEKLVQVFDRYATYNGSNPYETPGIMEVIPHYEFNVGAFFPEKGMIDIVDALVQLAKDLGVKFYFGSEIAKIVHDNGSVTGVRLSSGEKERADLVCCNMDIHLAYTKLLRDIQFPKKMMKQQRSTSGLIFYWGVKTVTNKLDVHNIFFADDYQEEFKNLFESHEVHSDPTIYVHISSKVKSDDAPKGCENWFVMINTPSIGEIDWEDYIEKARSYVVSKLSKLTGLDLESLIVAEQMMDPRAIEYNTYSYDGALYGAASNSKYAAFNRHPNFHRDLKNLYFVGGSVHPGGGIPLCLLSAKIVADNVK